MKKIFILFLVFLFLINFVSGASLRINPPKLDFIGNPGDKICNNISIYTDYNGNIITQARFSIINSKNIIDYKFDPDYFGLNLNFSEKMAVKTSKKENICLIAGSSGEYHGILLFNTEQSPAGVGIWISANITGPEDLNVLSNKITGNAVKDINNTNNSSNEKLFLIYSLPTIFLLFLLGLLIFYQKRVVR